MDRERLVALTREFLDAFNRLDLDAVMSFFAKDAVYEEFHGKENYGLAEIRAAFEPQFGGAWGEIRFLPEELVVDPEAREVMASWRCTLERVQGRPASWRGLDLLRFDDEGRVVRKSTYAKAKAPLLEPSGGE